jgi:hypothetical protein
MENKDLTGFETGASETDPETGKISWDIKYKADYALVYKRFKELNKAFKDFITYDEVRKDPKLMQFSTEFNALYNRFRTHIRKEYPKQFRMLQTIDENVVRDLVRKALEEESSTGAGADAGSFSPGEGAQYATKYAYNPNKKAKGAENIYYYKLGWKPVNAKKLHKQAKGLEHKDLWTKKLEETEESSQSYVDSLNLPKPALKQFIETRITDFDKIEDKINELLPLLKKAKTETMEYYKTSPDFQIKYGTDLAVDYLNDLITLFKDKK